MYMDKHKLIDFISRKYGDEDYFEVTASLGIPKNAGALIGTTFGSAEHLIRSQIYHETHEIHIVATITRKG